MDAQPRIPRNDYGVLGDPPELGAWQPRLSVSVVIPAYRAERTLPLTLASLAAQTYPRDLIEVIVVDDGDTPMDRLPDLAPEHTRVIRPRPGVWGKVAACAAGIEAAKGDVVHCLDADLVLCPRHLEAQMRWHHLAGYLVVLGHLRFVPGLDEIPASQVAAAIEAGALDTLIPDGTPQWTESRWDQTADLRQAGFHAFSVMVGATVSFPTALLRAAGGMDPSLVMGEDTELGYRLAQAGAVFVADRAARASHLGDSTVMRQESAVKRHNWPYLAERVPTFRWLRQHPRRSYLVPYVEAVVPAGGASLEEVRATVDGLLASRLPDVAVTIVGPWDQLGDERRDPLGDPCLDLRLIRVSYAGDARVTYRQTIPDSAFPVPFRLYCPPGWVPGRGSLGSLVKFANRTGLGVLSLALDERGDTVVFARLERTAAMNRARWCAGPHSDQQVLDRQVHEMFGTRWDSGARWEFARADLTPLADPPAAAWSAEPVRSDERSSGSRRPAVRRGRLRRTTTAVRRRLRSLVPSG